MIPWISYLVLPLVTAIILPTWWSVRRKLLDLEVRVVALETKNTERLEWIRGMDTKLDKVVSDVEYIRGRLSGDGNPKVRT